jgi:hypothetical protein
MHSETVKLTPIYYAQTDKRIIYTKTSYISESWAV